MSLEEQVEECMDSQTVCDSEWSLVEGVEFYVEYLGDFEGKRPRTIKGFFTKFDPATKTFLPQNKTGKLGKYHSNWCRNVKPVEDIKFEDWVKQQIPNDLSQKLDSLMTQYFTEYSIKQGVEFYIGYLSNYEGNKPKPIKSFFQFFDTITKTFLSGKKLGKLHKYPSHWRRNIKPKENLEFKDWIKSKIPNDLSQKLDSLMTQHFTKYSIKQGVEFYIEYLSNYEGNKPKPIKSFFQSFDPITKTFLPEKKTGKLKKYCKHWRINLKHQQNLEFKDWIKSEIPSNLSQRLDSLMAQHFTEYSLEQGVEFYIEHLSDYEEKHTPIKRFFQIFDTVTKTFLPGTKLGKLNKYYSYWSRNTKSKKKTEYESGKSITFTDYLIRELPEEQRQRATYYLKGLYLADRIKQIADFDKAKQILT